MRVVDTAILAALEGGGLTVHDGAVPSQTGDNGTVVVSAVPYVVYWSALGDDSTDDARVGGPGGLAVVNFQVTFVGQDRAQAKWAGEKADKVLFRSPLTVAGRTRRATLTASQRVIPDTSVKVLLADGSYVHPFYGALQGAVAAAR